MSPFLKQLIFYVVAITDAIFLKITYDWEWLNEDVKTASLIVGLVVGILTAIKFTQDIIGNHRNNRVKKLELKKLEKELIEKSNE